MDIKLDNQIQSNKVYAGENNTSQNIQANIPDSIDDKLSAIYNKMDVDKGHYYSLLESLDEIDSVSEKLAEKSDEACAKSAVLNDHMNRAAENMNDMAEMLKEAKESGDENQIKYFTKRYETAKSQYERYKNELEQSDKEVAALNDGMKNLLEKRDEKYSEANNQLNQINIEQKLYEDLKSQKQE